MPRYKINIIGTSRQEGWKRENFLDRVRAMHEFVAGIPEDGIVLHFDAYDVLFNAPPSAVASHMLSSELGVIFSAEKGCCAPARLLMSGKNFCDRGWPVPLVPTAMPFLNAGVWMGMQPSVLRMLGLALDEATRVNEEVRRRGWGSDYIIMGDQASLPIPFKSFCHQAVRQANMQDVCTSTNTSAYVYTRPLASTHTDVQACAYSQLNTITHYRAR